jgi:hypothetical protein
MYNFISVQIVKEEKERRRKGSQKGRRKLGRKRIQFNKRQKEE